MKVNIGMKNGVIVILLKNFEKIGKIRKKIYTLFKFKNFLKFNLNYI